MIILFSRKNSIRHGSSGFSTNESASSSSQTVIRTGNPFLAFYFASRCGCGRLSSSHSQLALSRFTTSLIKSKSSATTRNPHPLLAHSHPHEWNLLEHSEASPTDAFGTIEFQGGTHAHKGHYVRLGFDSDPEDIMYLMEKIWCLQRPRLVITVHGGTSNFQ